jgi:hypothetical protein
LEDIWQQSHTQNMIQCVFEYCVIVMIIQNISSWWNFCNDGIGECGRQIVFLNLVFL